MSLVLGCFFVIGSSKGGDSLVLSLGRRGGVASSEEVGKDLMSELAANAEGECCMALVCPLLLIAFVPACLIGLGAVEDNGLAS
jgi:hypothetical protein